MPEPLENLQQRLGAAFQVAAERGVPLTARGVSQCLLPPHLRNPDALVERGPDDVMAESCARCALSDACAGVPRWYSDAYGLGALSPLDERATQDDISIDPAAHPAPRRGPLLARRPGRFRVVLVNLCEATWGYGPGAAEYLRAELLSTPDLAERIDVEILFLVNQSVPQATEAILAAGAGFGRLLLLQLEPGRQRRGEPRAQTPRR